MIKEKKLSKALIAVALAVVMVLSVFVLGNVNRADEAESSRVGENILLAKGDKVTLMSGGNNEKYLDLIYGTAPHENVAKTANFLADDWFYDFSRKISATKESASTPATNVVTYGRITNVPLSVKLADTIDAYPETSIAWGIAYDHETGVLALYANSKAALEAAVSKTSSGHDLYLDLYGALGEYVDGTSFVVTEELFRVFELTEAEYNAIIAEDEEHYKTEREELKEKRLEELKVLVTKFNTSDFGTPETGSALTKDMGKAPSGSPHYYPTAGDHPRVLFTSEDIPAVRARIEELEGSDAYKLFTEYLNEDITGILPAAKKVADGYHNFDMDILAKIQANALGYVVYGDQLCGYRAIYAIKNYLLTLDIDGIVSDQTRAFGLVMYTTACVYDWCYDLLSEEDKIQLATGVEHRICRGSTKNIHGTIASTSQTTKMEMGFPPASQSATVGHGAEFQLQRDYLSMAIAVYDELPGWYEFIAGRFYNEYIPVHDIYYSSGLYPQGMSYGTWRFLSDCFGGALIGAATGKAPYTTDMANVVFTFLANEISKGETFFTGDTFVSSQPQSMLKYEALIISHMLYDTKVAPLLRLIEKSMSGNYLISGVSTVLVSEYFIFSSRKVEEASGNLWREELPLITYTGDYVGQYLSRNEWTDDAAVTMMRMSVRPTGNHDHNDAGTFQIYYKGLMSGSSGGYGRYGTDHWQYYHQATVAHNGILVFDPSKADTVPQQVMNADGTPRVDGNGNVSYSNEARLFYSGGQKPMSSPGTLDEWMQSSYLRAAVTGCASGYSHDGISPKYAYLAGDITRSYEANQASYVGRSMLTAYTGDKDIPMVFFVFDRIDAADESFIKKFLLQINGDTAPVIDSANKTVVVEDGEGQLVLQNVKGGTKIEALGGECKGYLINGVNCADNSFLQQDSWGRVEVSTTGSLSDIMVNVIYVTDRGNETILKAKAVAGVDKKTGEKKMLEGATIGGITALFSTETDRTVEEIVFTANGEGLMTYYIGGLFEGTWRISVDGKYEGSVYSTKNSGMITFEAPAGKEITITPGADIRPAGTEKLTYMTGGGTLGKDAPSFYTPGEKLYLPTNIQRGTDVFEGWYLDAKFTQRIEYIDESTTGSVVVYAKWASVFANEDFSEAEISLVEQTGGAVALNGLQYVISDEPITTFQTREEYGDKYLFWQTVANPSAANGEGQNGRGPSIYVNPTSSSIASMGADQITYVFELASGGTGKDMTLGIRVRNSSKREITLFTVDSGKIKLGGTEVVADLTADFVTVAVTVDFETGKLIAYASSHKNEISGTFAHTDRSQFTTELLSMRANGEGAIKIGKIQILEGDAAKMVSGMDSLNNVIRFPSEAKLPEGTSNKYVPGALTPLPEEGVTAEIDGIMYDLEGWYSDAALQNKITAVPADASGAYPVYAKWEESDYIIYPEEAILPDGMPKEYEKGSVTALPTEGVTGNVNGKICPLIGWYSDVALTNPITEIPANATGAFRIYAKWQEPNVISYPENVTVPAGSPTEYTAGVTLLLTPENKAGFVFGGWFSDETYTNKITTVPEGTEGVFRPYALFTKNVLSVSPDAAVGGEVSGYGYCVHKDTDNNGFCDACERCAIGCTLDANADHICDTCTKCICLPGSGHTSCAYCGTVIKEAQSGALGVSGLDVSFSDGAPGYAKVVDNGNDDYVELYLSSGNGPAYNCNSNDIGTITSMLTGVDKHVLVYTFELAAKEGVPILGLAMRFRPGSPQQFFGVNADGTFNDGVDTIAGQKLTTEMTKVAVAIDFDNEEIRYYFGDAKIAQYTREYKNPAASVDAWIAKYNVARYGVLQIRMQNSGAILVGDVTISVANPDYVGRVAS